MKQVRNMSFGVLVMILVMTGCNSPDRATDGETTAAGTVSETGTAFLDDEPGSALRSLTVGWNTDWSLHTVPYNEIASGGPARDGIPSIDDPKFESIEQAYEWQVGTEPVIVLVIDGDARGKRQALEQWSGQG